MLVNAFDALRHIFIGTSSVLFGKRIKRMVQLCTNIDSLIAFVGGNVPSWASNRETEDYLEFASKKNLATILLNARFACGIILSDHKRDLSRANP